MVAFIVTLVRMQGEMTGAAGRMPATPAVTAEMLGSTALRSAR